MFSSDPNSPLCAHHSRLQRKNQLRENDANAAELLGDLTDFSTADSVNLFLGNLVKQLARKRIARRDAVALAYISQLLLNSLGALHRQFAAEAEQNDIPPRLIFDSTPTQSAGLSDAR